MLHFLLNVDFPIASFATSSSKSSAEEDRPSRVGCQVERGVGLLSVRKEASFLVCGPAQKPEDSIWDGVLQEELERSDEESRTGTMSLCNSATEVTTRPRTLDT